MMKPIVLFVCLLMTQPLLAQAQSSRYKNEMLKLQTVIQKHFFDSSGGFYKEHAEAPAKDQHLYSYLWPICAMYQAANEIEKVSNQHLVSSMRSIIEAYYDPAPPSAGYASYIIKFGGGDRFYDDNQWLGITAMDTYTRTKSKTDLKFAEEIYRYMMTGFDTVLSGGLYWQENKKVSKNTCSNGPGIILALQLYQATKKTTYKDTALMLYNWVNKTLKAPSGIYWDNMRVNDKRIGKATFSYNTGTMLQSSLYLFEVTGDKKYLDDATAIADSSLNFFYGSGKFRDNYWFNAVLLRGYQHLLKYNKSTKYIDGFRKCLDQALDNQRDENGLFGKPKTLDLVAHGGMLEILARYALFEKDHRLIKSN